MQDLKKNNKGLPTSILCPNKGNEVFGGVVVW